MRDTRTFGGLLRSTQLRTRSPVLFSGACHRSQRVRQLEARLISRLRDYMEENVVDFEYYAPSQE